MSSPTDRLSTALAGRYRIERELGAGGMATVYLAHDIRHDRRVALKVLRPELAAVIGAERFLHEIKTTANLQHPHILGLIDSGEADGLLWYVMPFVEGESLRDRLARERQLPVDDAVRLAREVASALDYAHRHQVIHRDIKPENILLHDGSALVADFGIALAVTSAGATRMTETGMSLGTPAYMSPEQAMGERSLDARSDIYALGCVLYEMLAGEAPFTGPTAQAIVAKVITEKAPSAADARETVPPNVAAAIAKALNKVPADRFGTAAEFSQALGDAGYAGAQRGTAVAPTAASAPGAHTWWRDWRAYVAPAVLALVAAWGWLRPSPAPLVTRFDLAQFGELDQWASPPEFSPDDRRMLYTTSGGLVVRERDDTAAAKVPSGVPDAWSAVFSPDGRSIAFDEAFPGALKRMPLSGGQAVTLVRDSAQGYGIAWSDDGWIYYVGGTPSALMRVRDSGGASEVVLRPDSSHDELDFVMPALLPGNRSVLVTIVRLNGLWDVGAVDVAAHRLTILARGVRGLYASSGHLVTIQGDGRMMATPFDARRLVLTGRPVEVAQHIGLRQASSYVGLSRHGTLLYQSRQPRASVVRVSRDGHETPVDTSWTGDFDGVTLSPDGSRLAVSVEREAATEIWVRDLRTGSLARVAHGGIFNYRPSWTPDGASLVFTSDRNGRLALYRVRADASAPPEEVLDVPRAIDENVWSADGQWLVYRMGSGGKRDIYGFRPGHDTPPGVPLAAEDYDEFSPDVSPDGHWLAYASLETGKAEVYVRPFPNVSAGKWVVSRGGGIEPSWAPNGHELYYRSAADSLVSVEVVPGPTFATGARRSLFSAAPYTSDSRHRDYSAARDGSFYFVRPNVGPPPRYVMVMNWTEELKRR